MDSDTVGMTLGTRLVRALKNLFLFALIVGLAGVAVYALSTLNARTYRLEIREGKLFVLKGRPLPTGADQWIPSEASLADAYSPLELKGTTPVGLTDVKYGDRDELDRALFSVVEMLAKPRVASEVQKDLEEALALVRRADMLHGLSPEQRDSLGRLKSELSFYLARRRIEDAQRNVEEALAQLKLAAHSENRHSREASQMLLAVEAPAKTLSDALRVSVHQLSAPAPAIEATPTTISAPDNVKPEPAPKVP